MSIRANDPEDLLSTLDQPVSDVVVSGDRRYADGRFWAKPPTSNRHHLLSQVAVNASGCARFLQRAKPSAVAFDPDRKVAFSYGRQVYDAHGIYCDALNRIDDTLAYGCKL